MGDNAAPQPMSSLQPALESVSVTEFEDIIAYLSDVAHTLNSFLKIYSSGSGAFWDSHSFLVHLAAAYECFAVVIPAAFRRRTWLNAQRVAVVKTQFRRSQVALLRIFRLIVYQVCLRPVAERAADEDDVARGIERYLDVMHAVLAERHFLAHVHVLFPFDGDRDIILQSTYLVDEPRLAYVEDAFRNAATEHSRRRVGTQDAGLAEADYSDEQIEFETPDHDAACSSDVAGANLESMVSAVRDLLPELGGGFVELCLEEMGYDVERVINALLEDRLPVNVAAVDRGLENAHDTCASVSDRSTSLLSQRRNVFDGDQFDVFTRSDVDLDRVHRGKRDRMQEPAVRRVSYDVDDDVIYDDEYDDTYDSNVVVADDADSADEMTSRRPFVTPRVLAVLDRADSGDDLNDDEEQAAQRRRGKQDEQEEQEARRRRGDLFIEDPAVLRQRRDEQWASRHGQQTRGRAGDVSGAARGDVRGVARGHGQSADVTRNRAWKEKNRASRVHHNRKDLADRKRRV